MKQAIICTANPQARSVFSLVLADSGTHVAACPDVDELKHIASSFRFDICILAVPNANAVAEAVTMVKQASRETKTIAVAGNFSESQLQELFEAGLDDVLDEPVNPRKAIESVKRVMGGQSRATPSKVPTKADADLIKDILNGDENSTEMLLTPPVSKGHRARHLSAKTTVMRDVVAQLLDAREEPVGVLLRGEEGSEFELVAREFQLICGEYERYMLVMDASDVTEEGLATACSLERLKTGAPRVLYIPEVQKLGKRQQMDLIDYLREARRRSSNQKQLRIVCSVSDAEDAEAIKDTDFLEELRFIMPMTIRIPPLRERREEIRVIVAKIVLELTAVFPGYRVRNVSDRVIEWLEGRLWRGNYIELCAFIRTAIMNCPARTLDTIHLDKVPDADLDPDEAAAAAMLRKMEKAQMPRED